MYFPPIGKLCVSAYGKTVSYSVYVVDYIGWEKVGIFLAYNSQPSG
jgi:hypothetical protein